MADSSRSNRPTRADQAAAVRAEQERAERRRKLLAYAGIAAVLVVLVAGAVGFQRIFGAGNPTTSATGHFVAIGPEDAPHTVVVYEDFLCPFCGELEAATSDDLAELAAEGKVRVEYRPFELLGRISDYPTRAAAVFGVVLETDGAEVAKEFHDLLFEQQPEESGPYPSDDDLVALAVEAGADETEVRTALADGTGEQWVEGANDAADEADVRSTPTVLVDGEPFQDGRTINEMAESLIAKVS
jgi:protein-disulfide isomerase